jgi:TetR/AcrR family fatty acid metabolism transcriptional regulator
MAEKPRASLKPPAKNSTKNSKVGQKSSTIIDAALKVFGKKGYHNTTISDIARQAGVSEATIYEYFEGKEDLLFAIPGEITDRAVDFYEAMLPYLKGAENRIRGIIRAYYTLYRENPDYSSLVLLDIKHNRNFSNAENYEAVTRATGLVLKCINEGIESGEFRGDIDPYLIRSMILGTIEHIFFRWHLSGRKDDLQDFTDDMLDVLMGGIKKEEKNVYEIHLTLGEADSASVKER